VSSRAAVRSTEMVRAVVDDPLHPPTGCGHDVTQLGRHEAPVRERRALRTGAYTNKRSCAKIYASTSGWMKRKPPGSFLMRLEAELLRAWAPSAAEPRVGLPTQQTDLSATSWTGTLMGMEINESLAARAPKQGPSDA